MRKSDYIGCILILYLIFIGICMPVEARCEGCKEIRVAVEFNDHAASAHVAKEKGWFRDRGLNLSSIKSYVTGMALAAALARGDVQVAYICLVPAINVYANARVPIKIVSGTHLYGYGLVVNPEKIKGPEDLELPHIRIGCVREGGTVDVFMHKIIDKFSLDEEKILHRTLRMPPPAQLMAIKAKRIDAAFLPEQWASMAEDFGFKMLIRSDQAWPGMQGSVLVVTQSLLERCPESVRALVQVTERATNWISENREEAVTLVAHQLSICEDNTFPIKTGKMPAKYEISRDTLKRSMNRLFYSNAIDLNSVQEEIDYMARLGYIEHPFNAQELLDLRFIQ